MWLGRSFADRGEVCGRLPFPLMVCVVLLRPSDEFRPAGWTESTAYCSCDHDNDNEDDDMI